MVRCPWRVMAQQEFVTLGANLIDISLFELDPYPNVLVSILVGRFVCELKKAELSKFEGVVPRGIYVADGQKIGVGESRLYRFSYV